MLYNFTFPGITLPFTETNSIKFYDLRSSPYAIKINLTNVKTKGMLCKVIPKSLTFQCVNLLIIKSQKHI